MAALAILALRRAAEKPFATSRMNGILNASLKAKRSLQSKPTESPTEEAETKIKAKPTSMKDATTFDIDPTSGSSSSVSKGCKLRA